MNSLSISRIPYINSLSVLRIHLESTIVFADDEFNTMNSIRWIQYDEFNIFFAISQWFHHRFRDFRKNSLFRDFTLSSLSFSRNHYFFREINLNSLSASRFHYKFTICFANSPWIHHLFSKVTINTLSFSGIHYEFTIFFANSLSVSRIHVEFTFLRETTMNSLSFPLFHFKFTILFPKSLWIH